MAALATSNLLTLRAGLISTSICKPRCCTAKREGLNAKTQSKSYVSSCRPLKAYSSSVTALDSEHVAKVFSDESEGIVCYKSDSGEIVCEGPDEGPHFYPTAVQSTTKVVSTSVYMPDIQAAGVLPLFGEGMLDITVMEYKGTILCEGRDES